MEKNNNPHEELDTNPNITQNQTVNAQERKKYQNSTFKNQPPVKEPDNDQQPDEYEMRKTVDKGNHPYHELQLEEEMGVDSDVDVPETLHPTAKSSKENNQRNRI